MLIALAHETSTRRRPRWTLALVAVVALVAACTALLSVRADGGQAARCDRFTQASAARTAADVGAPAGRPVVVIGDSYSVGLGLTTPTESWPKRLAAPLVARVHVDGFSGSGFSARASGCGTDVAFAARAARAVQGDPEGRALVVVEGGLNDVDRSDAEIAAGFERLVRALGDREVLVVGPVDAPSRAARVPRVDALLERLAAEHGVGYVSMRHLDLPYLADGLHLTPAGHAVFGDAVARAIASR